MPAETLSCPMCGAPVASLDSSCCEHCGARLATVACPSCFAMIFQGAKFCSHCGARVDRTERESAVSQTCPHCKIGLTAVTVGNVNLRECTKCEGIWVDKETLEQICTDREEQSAILGLAVSLPQNAIGGADLTVRYYPCPACKSLMNRVNFARCSGVIVDVCRTHGTWFDRDELRRIVEFIRAGGFDKARALEIEELKRQREKLEAAQAAARTAPMEYNRANSSCPGTTYDLFDGISAAAEVLGHLFHR